ncbi:flagellar biosynthesis protein FlhA [Enterobacter ludwigii]|uniref:flagellar biosynthesis protein FlhA n=1 Tax=Enterobacter ludwigii TaxID=299767 RepID=UPI003F6F2727
MAISKFRQNLAILRKGQLGVPVLLLCVLAMVILPLSPLMLDILFTFNIVVAVLVLLVSINTQRPLDFAVFPTMLLLATLMRLSLNVASTRVVLLHGHEGDGAAGKVIEAFGQVVMGGDFVVGFVVFIILMIINFVVVTKGAERISEVSARFTLDAMPGKQMAIDADLNAGLINQQQARERRQEIAREADFYGSMDGASKFVRGDAVAGMMVLAINVLGGICIGIFSHSLDASVAFHTYVLLTIGDGLVAQIPSLLLSTAAAIIVTRVSDGHDISQEIKSQLLSRPSVLYTAAFILFMLAIVPNMPHFAFFSFAGLLGFVGWRQSKTVRPADDKKEDLAAIREALGSDKVADITWDNIPLVEPIGLNLGYKLVTLLDESQGNPLSERVRGVRQFVSESSGVLLPEIRIRQNFRLKPAQYAIHINGIRRSTGEVHTDKLMAIPGTETYGDLDGILDTDPAYGMSIIWIEQNKRAEALNLGYQVVDCASVVATHISRVVRDNLPDLFNYDDITQLHSRLSALAPRLAEDLNSALSYSQLLRVYRQLLLENISLKDIVNIATALLESSTVTKDPLLLTSDVRYALRRAIINHINGDKHKLPVFTMDNKLEDILLSALHQAQKTGKPTMDSFPVDPNILTQLQNNMPIIEEQMKAKGFAPVLLVTPQLRPLISRYGRLFASGLHILSYNEIPEECELSVVGTLA